VAVQAGLAGIDVPALLAVIIVHLVLIRVLVTVDTAELGEAVWHRVTVRAGGPLLAMPTAVNWEKERVMVAPITGRSPPVGLMAELAGLRDPSCLMVRVGRRLVVRQMTVHAGGPRRDDVVVESCRAPRRRRVTLIALLRKSAGRMVGRGRREVLVDVAGATLRRCIYPLAGTCPAELVAARAIRRAMRTAQRETCR